MRRRLNDLVTRLWVFLPRLIDESKALWRRSDSDGVRLPGRLVLSITGDHLPPDVRSVGLRERIQFVDVCIRVFVTHDSVRVLHRAEYDRAIARDRDLVDRSLLQPIRKFHRREYLFESRPRDYPDQIVSRLVKAAIRARVRDQSEDRPQNSRLSLTSAESSDKRREPSL